MGIFFLKKIIVFFVLHACCFKVFAQCSSPQSLYDKLIKVEADDNLDFWKKIEAVTVLRDIFDSCRWKKDSVYARMLHKLAVWEFYGNNNFQKAIAYTQQAIHINLNDQKESSPSFAVNSYLNLGIYYNNYNMYFEALQAYDSCIALSRKPGTKSLPLVEAVWAKGYIYFLSGLYQQSIDESDKGITLARKMQDDASAGKLYISKAQSYSALKEYEEAYSNLVKAGLYLVKAGNPPLLQRDFNIVAAKIAQGRRRYSEAQQYHDLVIRQNIKLRDSVKLADAYSDLGLFYRFDLKQNQKAEQSYKTALRIARPANDILSTVVIMNNLSELYATENRNKEALALIQEALNLFIPSFSGKSVLINPSRRQIIAVYNLHLLLVLLDNKAEAMLGLIKNGADSIFIKKTMETFLLADYVIDELRRKQSGLRSKLFWTNETRDFYRLAIEASHLANNPAGMLYFMEKSRAVLLNDKLNEIGSLAFLPAAEAEQEQQLRINITGLEKQKEALNEMDTAYSRVSQALLDAKEDFNRYIKTLETKFPVYYQYKYNTYVPSINDIRDKLLTRGQTYLSFFETDSLIYALLISKGDVQFRKISFPGYTDTVKAFTRLCKDRQLLNAGYSRYACLANMLYQKLVAPFNIPEGKMIVSPDLHFIPLDALTKDKAGKEFLVYDYSFDYTYSAGYLVRAVNNNTALTGAGFLGVAPETFASDLSLARLYGSVTSLESIFNKYAYGQLLKYSEATRHFFLNNAGTFSLLHLYAHAKAGGGGEPVLYMNDSAVAVSELRQWNNPKVGLAFLAACETGAGELYTGEGINSIARSFAAVGVPSTIATLWKVDNKAMYALSEKFYYYLHQGLPKDEALQKAKIDFIEQGSGEDLLPYYWASAVLSGNAGSVKLPAQNTLKKYWLIPLLFAFATGAAYYRKKFYRRKAAPANI
jgi:CHAT domain-containing protein/tetratricopeptide (TPR) repeat protein